ncbi:hypothetical protein [Bradyrhizobium zhanjiangense]|uniref:Uncharacterized protein n=1 Tax=Bradyrhizobium zhanjiangense TaxID=1325107 RepID=A0A4Q0QBK5_9BRAD|nr:hypothetical protein [Bradyrhizobium zhanjiangense]RXG86651.1 hypothetical protein EAS61_32765 [Bradyrhizobium zhanjiangense]
MSSIKEERRRGSAEMASAYILRGGALPDTELFASSGRCLQRLRSSRLVGDQIVVDSDFLDYRIDQAVNSVQNGWRTAI